MAGKARTLGRILKLGLPALGLGAGGAAAGYSVAEGKGKEKLKNLGAKATNVIKGQQRLIMTLARQNQALANAYRRRVASSRSGGR